MRIITLAVWGLFNKDIEIMDEVESAEHKKIKLGECESSIMKKMKIMVLLQTT